MITDETHNYTCKQLGLEKKKAKPRIAKGKFKFPKDFQNQSS